MNKVLSLDQAVSYVRSGCTLGLGGMTLYRRPVAFVRALLGTDVTDLTRPTMDQASRDQVPKDRASAAMARRS